MGMCPLLKTTKKYALVKRHKKSWVICYWQLIILFGFNGQPRKMTDMPLPLYPFSSERIGRSPCVDACGCPQLARTEKQQEAAAPSPPPPAAPCDGHGGGAHRRLRRRQGSLLETATAPVFYCSERSGGGAQCRR